MKAGYDGKKAWYYAKNDLVYARSNVPDYDELADDEGKYCDGLCLNKLLLLQTGHIMAVRGIEATETAKLLEEVSKQESAANDNKYDRDIDLESEYKKLPKKDQRKIQQDVKLINALENEISDNIVSKEKGVLDGKLKIVAEKASYYMDRYNKYEHSHPILAKTYLISGLILAKGLIGAGVAGASTGGIGIIPGFISGITKGSVDEARGAIIGFAIGDDIGEFINKGIEDYSPILIKLDSTLSAQEAAILASISLAALLSSSEFASFAKAVKGADFSDMKISNGKLDGTFSFKKEFPDTKSHADVGEVSKKVEIDNDIPGIDKSFRGENIYYPADSNIVEFMNSEKITRLINSPGYDCSELAQQLFKSSNGKGKIIEVMPNKAGTLKLFEDGKKTTPEFSYHQVYSDGKYVYDPRLSSNPVPKGDWEKMIKKLNPDGVKINE